MASIERKDSAYKRAQVVECRVARSLVQPEPAVVGWADGYLLALNDGKRFVGQKMKAKLVDVRRSYATASVLPGTNRAVDKGEPV